MARGRLVSRTLGSSRKYAAVGRGSPLGEFAQSLYPLLIACSDDFGRLAGDAFTVKHAVFPTSPRTEAEFDQALDEMGGAGLIARYTVDSTQVIEIADFEGHQPGLNKRTRSKFPGPPGKFPEIPSELNRTELKGREGKGTEEGKAASVDAPEKAAADAAPQSSTAETDLAFKIETLAKAHHFVQPEAHRPTVALVELLVLEQAAKLPNGLADPDLCEAVKCRCATLRLTYDGELIQKAIASETAKQAKGVSRKRPSPWTSVGELAKARRSA